AAGRGILRTVERVATPLEHQERRRVALEYNEQFPSKRMDAAAGYALLPPGALTGTDDVIATCRRLFQAKTAALESAESTGTPRRRQERKREFLKNLLQDDDLASNPDLVDFALSDPLLSVVTNYLGIVPRLNRIDLLYSVPRENDDFVASQLFHQDPEGLTQAKLFLNIFDVAESNGPLMFIPADTSE